MKRSLANSGSSDSEGLRLIFENAGIGMAKVDLGGRFTQVNPALARLFGYSEEELGALTFRELTYPEDLEKSQVWHDELVSRRARTIFGEKRYVRKDGRTIWARVSLGAVSGHDGSIEYFATTVEDITERKRVDELLRKQSAIIELMTRSRSLNETLTQIALLIEEQAPGCRVSIFRVENERLTLGVAPSFPISFVVNAEGLPIGPEKGGAGTAAHFGRRIIAVDIVGDPCWDEYRQVMLDLGVRSVWSNPVHGKDGKVVGTINMYWKDPREPSPPELELADVATRLMALAIERSHTESRLNASAEQQHSLSLLQATFDATADGILVVQGNQLTAFNQRFLDIWGLPSSLRESRDKSQALNLVLSMLKDPDGFAQLVREQLNSPEERVDVIEFKDGRIFERHSRPQMLEGKIIGRVNSFRDVTEQRRLENQLRTADRLASLGRLSAGVVQEINNPLSHVVMSLELAIEKLGRRSNVSPLKLDSASRLIELAQKSAHRIVEIVKDLNTFSHPESDELESVDVSGAIENAIAIVENQVRHRARLVRDYGLVRPVHANEGRLNQVMVNLLFNASQAIREGNVDGNEVRIKTWTDPATSRIVIEVSDTGEGMSEETRRHAFEPFFTTKPPGSGTGLGLSICYNIVQSFGGEIEVSSAMGRGTTVRVLLKPARASASASKGHSPILTLADANSDGQPAAKRGRIVVIDDEELIGEMMQEALQDEHDVVTTTDGATALRLILDPAHRVDLVICDLMMPDMTGMDLYEKVKAAFPGMEKKIVFVTGGAFSERAREFIQFVPNRIVHKPIGLGSLRGLAEKLIADT